MNIESNTINNYVPTRSDSLLSDALDIIIYPKCTLSASSDNQYTQRQQSTSLGLYGIKDTPINCQQLLNPWKIKDERKIEIGGVLNYIKNIDHLKQYYGDCCDFNDYLDRTSKMYFKAYGIEKITKEEKEAKIPYKHRWSEGYRKGKVASMYLLEEWWENQGRVPVTMLTLTTYHGDGDESVKAVGEIWDIERSWRELKEGWKKLSMYMRKYYPDLKYFWVIEPHLKGKYPGYAHMHIAVFGEVDSDIVDKVKYLYTEKYNLGSKEHGVDFTCSSPRSDIKSLRNYLLKYMSKNFLDENFFKSDIKSASGQFVFNAIAKKFKFRTFGSSREISEAIKYWSDPSEVDWYRVEMYYHDKNTGNESYITTWEKTVLDDGKKFDELTKSEMEDVMVSINNNTNNMINYIMKTVGVDRVEAVEYMTYIRPFILQTMIEECRKRNLFLLNLKFNFDYLMEESIGSYKSLVNSGGSGI